MNGRTRTRQTRTVTLSCRHRHRRRVDGYTARLPTVCSGDTCVKAPGPIGRTRLDQQAIRTGVRTHQRHAAIGIGASVGVVGVNLFTVPPNLHTTTGTDPHRKCLGAFAGHRRHGIAAHVGCRTMDRIKVHVAHARDVGIQPPTHTTLLAVPLRGRFKRLRLGFFRTVGLTETSLAFVVEGTNHLPVGDVAKLAQQRCRFFGAARSKMRTHQQCTHVRATIRRNATIAVQAFQLGVRHTRCRFTPTAPQLQHRQQSTRTTLSRCLSREVTLLPIEGVVLSLERGDRPDSEGDDHPAENVQIQRSLQEGGRYLPAP